MAKQCNNNGPKNMGPKRNRLLIDSINLFSGDRSGHMSRYAYGHAQKPGDPAQGGKHWKDFIANSTEYYMYREERDLIQDNAQKIIAHLPDNISVIELGPGESRALREKTVPLLRAFNNAAGNQQPLKKLEEYIALDISPEFAKGAEAKIAQQLRIPSQSIISDFTEDGLSIKTTATPVMTIFGGTLFNASVVKGYNPEYALKSYLEDIHDIVGPGGHVILTQDTNMTHDSLLNAYKHDSLEKTVMSVMHRIERDLDTRNFNGYDFDHLIRWNPYMSLLTLNAVSKVDKVMKVGGVTFNLKKGDTFPLVNAFKYSTARFEKIVEDAGFDIVDTIKDGKDNRIALHVLRVPSHPHP